MNQIQMNWIRQMRRWQGEFHLRLLQGAAVFVVAGASVPLLNAQVAPAKSATYQLIFNRLDGDGDGKVTAAELEKQGRKTTLIDSADKDGDRVLSREEVYRFFQRRVKDGPEASSEPIILVHEFPESSRVDEASCRSAAEYSASKNGYSTVVMVDGRVVFERYDQGWGPETSHRLASGTKSFSGAILGVAVKDGLLTLDEPVADTITEWQSNEALSGISIRHLLSLTSGLDPGAPGVVPSYTDAVVISDDGEPETGPGEKFAYGPRPFQIFGEILRRKLAADKEIGYADPLAYLEARIFEPIGLSYAEWLRDENGMPKLPSGARLTASEWCKFGELLRNGGIWGGEELLDPKVLKECLTGSSAYPGYGVTFWLLDNNPARVEKRNWIKGGFMAAGKGKQRLYVIPKTGVVVVRQGESTVFEDLEMLDLLFLKESEK